MSANGIHPKRTTSDDTTPADSHTRVIGGRRWYHSCGDAMLEIASGDIQGFPTKLLDESGPRIRIRLIPAHIKLANLRKVRLAAPSRNRLLCT